MVSMVDRNSATIAATDGRLRVSARATQSA